MGTGRGRGALCEAGEGFVSSTQGMPSDSRPVPASEPAPLRTSKRTAGKPWLAEMTKVVGKIMEREDAEVFREPVDWRGLGLFRRTRATSTTPLCDAPSFPSCLMWN